MSFYKNLFLFSTLSFMLYAKELPMGYPDRSAELDAFPGFQSPPKGYGQVPFWWWTGDDLNEERLLWQLEQLHEKGISGVQVNYSHTDEAGWPSDVREPKIFTDEWWKVYSKVAAECSKRDMGISLSTYTLDWDNGAENLFYNLFYSKPELNAMELKHMEPVVLEAGEVSDIDIPENFITARAHTREKDTLFPSDVDLKEFVKDGKLVIQAPEDGSDWEIWVYYYEVKEGTLNPLLASSGATVIRDFYQKFEDNSPDKTAKGLNFFFNDELEVGLKKFAWDKDFPAVFLEEKGYDVFRILPTMWEVEMPVNKKKMLIDYADVRMKMMEERYFKPIYDWHTERGIIFGCDNHGRGLQPDAYGDYYRATKWYSAPGHDTPKGSADLLKGKVSSSIAHVYQRPRVWLEGYHSLGWGATPENLMFATRENYLYGCTLLNLHGLYYSTYGSHWEWAPPCYHFRMPYWAHMETFLKYFDRLSYLMSQGQHVCDVALIYPVTPYEAELGGDEAKDTSFATAEALIKAGINFDFIDHQTIDRLKVDGDRLVSEEGHLSYKTLIFPNMAAARWSNLEQAQLFKDAGGQVLNIGTLPSFTNLYSEEDQKLADVLAAAFPEEARVEAPEDVLPLIKDAYTQDVKGLTRPVRAYHRKIGYRDVYMVMDAEPDDIVEFRAKGKVELWDPWTGKSQPLQVVEETEFTTQVVLPLEPYEAQIIVFNAQGKHENPEAVEKITRHLMTLPTKEWTVSFLPTMDNQWGDFRLPVTDNNKMIGLEAREFKWAVETEDLIETGHLPETFDGGWKKQLHGHGSVFKLNDERYEMSWRSGHRDDIGHQGFHGSKGKISDNFIRLGNFKETPHGGFVLDTESPGPELYVLRTTVAVEKETLATVHIPEAAEHNAPYASPNTVPVVRPTEIYIGDNYIDNFEEPVTLKAGMNHIKIVYDTPGESHFVLKRTDVKSQGNRPPLSMTWYNDPSVLKFSPNSYEEKEEPVEEPSEEGAEEKKAPEKKEEKKVVIGDAEASEDTAEEVVEIPALEFDIPAEWFRFTSAPGTTQITIPSHLSTTPPQVWYNGEPMKKAGKGVYKVVTPVAVAGTVAIRLTPPIGVHGGALLPEPLKIESNNEGVMELGDWSDFGVLAHYSGGVTYKRKFLLDEYDLEKITTLTMEKVSATAGVKINGKEVGVRVAPPWKFSIADALKVGENVIEITVYNTLSNHYQTIPNQYKGSPISGLFGPVSLIQEVK